MKSNIEKC